MVKTSNKEYLRWQRKEAKKKMETFTVDFRNYMKPVSLADKRTVAVMHKRKM